MKKGGVILVPDQPGPRLGYVFHFCDPGLSFGPGSLGMAKRALIGSWPRDEGHLGRDAWHIGKVAYDHLTKSWGGPPEVRDLHAALRSSWPAIEELFVLVAERYERGEVVLVNGDGAPHTEPWDWRSADITSQLSSMLRLLAQLAADRGEGPLEGFSDLFAVAALAQLDRAVLLSLDNVNDEVVSAILEATWMVDHIQIVDRISKAAGDLAVKRESARAKERARKRHDQDPKQQAKRFVYDRWLMWRSAPSLYPSKAAFARDMLDKQEDLVSTQVVERWTREWAKGPRNGDPSNG